ncbi:hypothetical protein [Flavobacterium pectinovorum]|uniref:hypothetical protein n=1 Tax=Flavobacterium pectinovorum TaxID=29533 RepID=UPI001FACD972|nr:hypothetical protein [Flavobacterium pectinovorum]MCI9845579.1 hypothetical protein [Flavobacterium pectinovorum]
MKSNPVSTCGVLIHKEAARDDHYITVEQKRSYVYFNNKRHDPIQSRCCRNRLCLLPSGCFSMQIF